MPQPARCQDGSTAAAREADPDAWERGKVVDARVDRQSLRFGRDERVLARGLLLHVHLTDHVVDHALLRENVPTLGARDGDLEVVLSRTKIVGFEDGAKLPREPA